MRSAAARGWPCFARVAITTVQALTPVGQTPPPLAVAALEDETYGELTRAALDACRRVGAAGPVVLLEGGYDLDAVEHGAREVVSALVG